MFKAPTNQSAELNRTLFGGASTAGGSISEDNPFDVLTESTTKSRPPFKARRRRP